MDRAESLECPFAGLAFTELRHSLLGRVLVLTGAHSFTRMNRVAAAAAAAASWMMVTLSSGFVDAAAAVSDFRFGTANALVTLSCGRRETGNRQSAC